MKIHKCAHCGHTKLVKQPEIFVPFDGTISPLVQWFIFATGATFTCKIRFKPHEILSIFVTSFAGRIDMTRVKILSYAEFMSMTTENRIKLMAKIRFNPQAKEKKPQSKKVIRKKPVVNKSKKKVHASKEEFAANLMVEYKKAALLLKVTEDNS